jgi:hypothetical protein
VGNNFRLAKEIAQVACRQLGNVTRAQLRTIGLDDAAIHRRVRAGGLYRVHCGVYAVGRPPITPQERAMAAVLACGPGAVLSHGSALALWGIWKRWDMPCDVMTKLDRRPKGVSVHRNKLRPGEVTRQLDIPTTTLARALLDTAPDMRPKSLNRAINNGRQAGHVHLDALIEVAQRNPRHPGRKKLEYCIGIAPERPSRSQFEDDFPVFCQRHGLPQPETNCTICGYSVDAVFVAERVIVELDGWDFHSSRVSFEDDRERDATTTAAGFVTVRITKPRFEEQPQREAKRLQAILAQRRSA